MATGTILTRLARVWWVTALLAILGGLGGLVYSWATPPTYVAKVYVAVVATNQNESLSAVSYAQTYARVVSHSAILRAAAASGVASESELRSNVQAAGSTDSPVIEISGSAGTAPRAADLANAVARGLVNEGDQHSSSTRMRLTVLSAASPPDSPTSPSPALNVAIGVAVGILLGGLTVLARPDPKPGDPRRRDTGDLTTVGTGPPAGAGTATAPERWNDVPGRWNDGPGRWNDGPVRNDGSERWNGHSEPGGSSGPEAHERGWVRR